MRALRWLAVAVAAASMGCGGGHGALDGGATEAGGEAGAGDAAPDGPGLVLSTLGCHTTARTVIPAPTIEVAGWRAPEAQEDVNTAARPGDLVTRTCSQGGRVLSD
ncbi:MAG: hypothetical protein HY906_28190 [Deltaproteobacteria bacterium]|nr:hypothetical protein [Deltaproteobacteria bacterium]